MQTLIKLGFNFTSIKFKQKITTLKTVIKNSDRMSNEHTWYNPDVRFGYTTV